MPLVALQLNKENYGMYRSAYFSLLKNNEHCCVSLEPSCKLGSEEVASRPTQHTHTHTHIHTQTHTHTRWRALAFTQVMSPVEHKSCRDDFCRWIPGLVFVEIFVEMLIVLCSAASSVAAAAPAGMLRPHPLSSTCSGPKEC